MFWVVICFVNRLLAIIIIIIIIKCIYKVQDGLRGHKMRYVGRNNSMVA